MTIKAPWITHFGFTRTPFSKTLAPSELFTRAPHQEAVARILHCIQESALCVITGEVEPGLHYALLSYGVSSGPGRTGTVFGHPVLDLDRDRSNRRLDRMRRVTTALRRTGSHWSRPRWPGPCGVLD